MTVNGPRSFGALALSFALSPRTCLTGFALSSLSSIARSLRTCFSCDGIALEADAGLDRGREELGLRGPRYQRRDGEAQDQGTERSV